MHPLLQDAHDAMLEALEAMAKRAPDAQARFNAARMAYNTTFTMLMLSTRKLTTPTTNLKGTSQ